MFADRKAVQLCNCIEENTYVGGNNIDKRARKMRGTMQYPNTLIV
jgi:hypothetical protein